VVGFLLIFCNCLKFGGELVHFRYMGMESFDRTPVDKPSELLKKTNQLQMLLAMRLYKKNHPDEVVLTNDPRENAPTVRRAAMDDWNEGYSERFNTLLEKHPIDSIDVEDPVVIGTLFALLDQPKKSVPTNASIGELENRGLTL